MSIIRVQKNENYSCISNIGLNDSNLSFKAKGILAYLLSKPNEWTCQVHDLGQNAKDGRDSIYNGLKELRANGYLIKRPIKIKGKVSEWEEILFETPQEEAITIYKEQEIKNELAAIKRAETIKQKKSHSGNPEVEKTTFGKSGNGKSGNGKSGNIISTDLTNTNLTNTNLLVVEACQLFQENICELKRTTKEKFIKYCTDYDIEFIKSVINLCAESGTLYFSGFKVILDTYIANNIITKESLEKSVAEYRAESQNLKDKEREKRKASANKPTSNKTNNMDPSSNPLRELDSAGLKTLENDFLGRS